ncbi:MAG: hypothetical protein ACI4R9_06705, partial [Kiritimatiellia bacterium]
QARFLCGRLTIIRRRSNKNLIQRTLDLQWRRHAARVVFVHYTDCRLAEQHAFLPVRRSEANRQIIDLTIYPGPIE